jgi:Predicted membrane protein
MLENKLNKIKILNYYLFVFFICSVGGYIGEIIFMYFLRNKIINPGSMLGPWLPIYGIGAIIIFFMVKRLKKFKFWQNAILLFCITSIVEYIGAFLTNKILKKVYWNYSKLFLNLHGYICLSMSLLFTAIGLVTIYFIKPKIDKMFINKYNVMKIINAILIILFCTNIILEVIK